MNREKRNLAKEARSLEKKLIRFKFASNEGKILNKKETRKHLNIKFMEFYTTHKKIIPAYKVYIEYLNNAYEDIIGNLKNEVTFLSYELNWDNIKYKDLIREVGRLEKILKSHKWKWKNGSDLTAKEVDGLLLDNLKKSYHKNKGFNDTFKGYLRYLIGVCDKTDINY